MQYLKIILSKLEIVSFIIILTFILTIINIIWSVNGTINSLIALIVILLYSFIKGIKVGLKTTEKAYVVGFKVGLVNVFILLVMSLLFLNYHITIKKVIYYAIILITTILGSIIGINKRN